MRQRPRLRSVQGQCCTNSVKQRHQLRGIGAITSTIEQSSSPPPLRPKCVHVLPTNNASSSAASRRLARRRSPSPGSMCYEAPPAHSEHQALWHGFRTGTLGCRRLVEIQASMASPPPSFPFSYIHIYIYIFIYLFIYGIYIYIYIHICSHFLYFPNPSKRQICSSTRLSVQRVIFDCAMENVAFRSRHVKALALEAAMRSGRAAATGAPLFL